jgi:hypothetical protein
MQEVQEYIHKPDPVLAVRITRENYEEVATWCGGHPLSIGKASDPSDVYIAVEVPTMEGVRRTPVGDYIVKNQATGRFYPLSAETFERRYQRKE